MWGGQKLGRGTSQKSAWLREVPKVTIENVSGMGSRKRPLHTTCKACPKARMRTQKEPTKRKTDRLDRIDGQDRKK